MCGFRACTGETAATVPVLNSLPSRPNLNLHWPGKLCLLQPSDSLGHCLTQLMPLEALLKVGSQPQVRLQSLLDNSWVSASPRQTVSDLGMSYASNSALVPNLNLHLPGKHHSTHPSDSLRPWFTQLAYHPELNSSFSG